MVKRILRNCGLGKKLNLSLLECETAFESTSMQRTPLYPQTQVPLQPRTIHRIRVPRHGENVQVVVVGKVRQTHLIHECPASVSIQWLSQ